MISIIACDEAHHAVTSEIRKHDALLRPGENFELDLPDEKKSKLEGCQALLPRHFLASKEFMLLLTLEKPTNTKLSDRLLDHTAAIGSHCGRPWQQCITSALATMVDELMKEKEENHKKEKKDKKKDTEKKEKKDKKVKKGK